MTRISHRGRNMLTENTTGLRERQNWSGHLSETSVLEAQPAEPPAFPRWLNARSLPAGLSISSHLAGLWISVYNIEPYKISHQPPTLDSLPLLCTASEHPITLATPKPSANIGWDCTSWRCPKDIHAQTKTYMPKQGAWRYLLELLI